MQSIVVAVNVLLILDVKDLSEQLQELCLIFMTVVFQSDFFNSLPYNYNEYLKVS